MSEAPASGTPPGGREAPPVEPATVLGLFLAAFALLVFIAIGFTTTAHGKITDAVCGAILLGIAGLLLWIGKKKA